MKSKWEGFMDITEHDFPYPYISYRSANFVFEEGLRNGHWVSLYYNAAGYIGATNPNPLPSSVELDYIAQPESFDVVLDGQSLDTDWLYEGCRIEKTAEKITSCVSLRHQLRPVRVEIHTVVDGTPMIARTVRVENLSDSPAAISAFAPLCGGVQTLSTNQNWYNQFQPEHGKNIWQIGYFADTGMQGSEGEFRWVDLPSEKISVCGRYRRDRFRHPMFLLNNHLSGETMMVQFAWSGGYSFDFDYLYDWGIAPTLSLRVAMDSPAPMRVLKPHESWSGPEVHFGMVFGGMDEAVNGMNHHLRKVMLPKKPELRERVVCGFGLEYPINAHNAMLSIDYAANIGAEAFFIDAGYDLQPDDPLSRWYHTIGDWQFNPERFPKGMGEVRDYCHEKGILFGLWMEPERIGRLSHIYAEHPEWVMKNRKGEPNRDGYLDLSIPEAAEWMEAQMIRFIKENQLDFFRIDHNPEWPEYIGSHLQDGYRECSFVRNEEVIYGIFSRLRERFPNVIFESCASGGGRTDVGMVKYFHQTWVTDYQRLPHAFRITNGMTMALPPECINRMIGGQHTYLCGDIQAALRNLLFTQMSVCGIRWEDMQANPLQMEEVRRTVQFYKDFVRPMLPECDIYHHTPELPGYPPTGFGILELDAKDGRKGITGIFRLSDPCGEETVVRLRGIDASCRYRITLDNTHASYEAEGWQLMQEGIRVRVTGPLTSELIIYEALIQQEEDRNV